MNTKKLLSVGLFALMAYVGSAQAITAARERYVRSRIEKIKNDLKAVPAQGQPLLTEAQENALVSESDGLIGELTKAFGSNAGRKKGSRTDYKTQIRTALTRSQERRAQARGQQQQQQQRDHLQEELNQEIGLRNLKNEFNALKNLPMATQENRNAFLQARQTFNDNIATFITTYSNTDTLKTARNDWAAAMFGKIENSIQGQKSHTTFMTIMDEYLTTALMVIKPIIQNRQEMPNSQGAADNNVRNAGSAAVAKLKLYSNSIENRNTYDQFVSLIFADNGNATLEQLRLANALDQNTNLIMPEFINANEREFKGHMNTAETEINVAYPAGNLQDDLDPQEEETNTQVALDHFEFVSDALFEAIQIKDLENKDRTSEKNIIARKLQGYMGLLNIMMHDNNLTANTREKARRIAHAINRLYFANKTTQDSQPGLLRTLAQPPYNAINNLHAPYVISENPIAGSTLGNLYLRGTTLGDYLINQNFGNSDLGKWILKGKLPTLFGNVDSYKIKIVKQRSQRDIRLHKRR